MKRLARLCRLSLYALTIFLAGMLCAAQLARYGVFASRADEYAAYQGYLQGLHLAALYQLCTHTVGLPEQFDRLWQDRQDGTPRWTLALTCEDMQALQSAPHPVSGGPRHGL